MSHPWTDELYVIHAAPHPSPLVRDGGFPLGHAYIEYCWTARLGPSCTLFLQRLPLLWQAEHPARCRSGDLAAGLGITAGLGMARTWRRLLKFGLAEHQGGSDVAVFTTVPPLSQRFVDQAPVWVRETHHRLLDEHRRSPTPPHLGRSGAGAVSVRTRLDHYERTTVPNPTSAPPPPPGR